MERRRVARFVVLGAGLIAALLLSKRWPEEQTVRYVLGDLATQVEEVDARWIEGAPSGECVRDVRFRYPRGRAPRVVTHTPRLAEGDYTVEVDVVAGGRQSVVRHVALQGGVTSIDLSRVGPLSLGDPCGACSGASDGPRHAEPR